MSHVIEADGTAHVIEIDGALDVPEATRLCDTILSFDPGDDVVVDCHEVRDLQDAALAFLARRVCSRGRRVELRGLGEHQLRILRYLGVGSGGTPPELGDEVR